MTAPDVTAIQLNFKIGSGLFNGYAQNPEQACSLLVWFRDNAADIAATQALLEGVAVVTATPPASQQAQSFPPGAQPAQSSYQQPAQQRPAGPGVTCTHGPMTPRSGSKNGRDWSGHF